MRLDACINGFLRNGHLPLSGYNCRFAAFGCRCVCTRACVRECMHIEEAEGNFLTRCISFFLFSAFPSRLQSGCHVKFIYCFIVTLQQTSASSFKIEVQAHTTTLHSSLILYNSSHYIQDTQDTVKRNHAGWLSLSGSMQSKTATTCSTSAPLRKPASQQGCILVHAVLIFTPRTKLQTGCSSCVMTVFSSAYLCISVSAQRGPYFMW